MFAFGFGSMAIDLFEVDSIGDIFAVPFMGGGDPIFLNSSLRLPLATVQDDRLVALLASANGQDFVIDIINSFSASVEAAVCSTLHL